MKIKTVLSRIFITSLLLMFFYFEANTQGYDEFNDCLSIPAVIYYIDDQPLIAEDFILLDEWMLNEDKFSAEDRLVFIFEPWMIDFEGLDGSPEGLLMMAGWMMNEGFEENCADCDLTRWMIEFDPLILRHLIVEDVECPAVEKWMFENNYVSDKELFSENNERLPSLFN